MTTETTSKTAHDILSEAGVAYVALYAGETKRDDWACDAWKVAFTKTGVGTLAGESVTFDYFTGLGLRAPAGKPTDGGPAPRRNTLMWEALEKARKPIVPDVSDVLYALASDASAAESSFDDWCDDFGYDNDSRKALATYLACQETATKLRRMFTTAQLEAIREFDN